ncbi:class I SAM-dependent methyltransferase family protein [Catenulispora subtropica]|uniref:Methyltransferase domain-containing protein n=1 Tax=Catenulispora subtropica TaxID=450798 RepID=A0ABN2T2N6_9ACTN
MISHDAIVGQGKAIMTGLRDWKPWFAAYDDPASPLASRLAVVRDGISRALRETAPGPIRILSLCAGEGRDVIPVVAAHPRRADVTARLVEFDPEIADVARRAVAEAGLADAFDVVTGDAADPARFAGFGPADLLLLCGIFGNISDADIAHTVANAAGLTARHGTVIWTRHRREPNLVPSIHGWFAEAGFTSLWESDPALPESIYVAGHRQDRDPAPLRGDAKLFTFIK